jgi:hypothetical protein
MVSGSALALSGGACEVGYYDPYVDYVPYYPDWTFWYDDVGYDDGGWWYLTSVPPAANTLPSDAVQPLPGVDELKELKARMGAFNTSVKNVMTPLSELVKEQSSSLPGAIKQYGPLSLPQEKPTATFRLTVQKLQTQKYGWRLSVKPVGAADTRYQTVLAGSLANAIEAHRGTGQAGLNLDNLHAVNPAAYPTTGQIIAASVAAPGRQGALVARLIGFSPDDTTPPISARLALDRTPGRAHLRWQGTAERVAGTPDKGPEQVVDYLTWTPQKGGRLYTIIENGTDENGMPQGDLPENTYLLGEACYAPDSVLLYQAWNSCENSLPAQCLGTPPVLIETQGKTAADCAAGTDSPPPPAATPETGATPTAPVIPPPLPESVHEGMLTLD